MEKRLYDLAKEKVESRRSWPSGHVERVWTGRKHSASITNGGRDGGGLLYLGFRNGKPGQEALCICAYLSPLKGWVWSLDEAGYRDWVVKARRLLEVG